MPNTIMRNKYIFILFKSSFYFPSCHSENKTFYELVLINLAIFKIFVCLKNRLKVQFYYTSIAPFAGRTA